MKAKEMRLKTISLRPIILGVARCGTHKDHKKTLEVTEPGTHLMPTVAWWFTTKKLMTVVAPCKQGVSGGDGYTYELTDFPLSHTQAHN
jgi:hypothetical protein